MTEIKRSRRKPLALSEQSRLDGTGEELGFIKSLRAPIIKAFREYESDVNYGVLSESAEEHDAMLSWYAQITADSSSAAVATVSALSDENVLKAAAIESIKTAIQNVPEGVRRYLK